jgi:hypothetical protein
MQLLDFTVYMAVSLRLAQRFLAAFVENVSKW